jgi:hypothetical protein
MTIYDTITNKMHNLAIYNFTIKTTTFRFFKNRPQGENTNRICIKHICLVFSP